MIYKLRADRQNFLSFDIDPFQIELILGDYFLLHQSLWAEFWAPLNVNFYEDSDHGGTIQVPDITVWGTENCLALNEKAYATLKDQLDGLGEFLPIECEGIPYWLFHSTLKTGMEYIDINNSARTIDEVDYVEMQALQFNEQALEGKLVFQTEFSNYRNMYCTEEFKQLVESNGLHGLYFSTDLACVNEP